MNPKKKIRFFIALAVCLCLTGIFPLSDFCLPHPAKVRAEYSNGTVDWDNEYNTDYDYDDADNTSAPSPAFPYNEQNAYTLKGDFQTELIDAAQVRSLSLEVTETGILSLEIQEHDLQGYYSFYLESETGQSYGPFTPSSYAIQNKKPIMEEPLNPGKYVLTVPYHQLSFYLTFHPADCTIASGKNISFDTAENCSVNQDIYGATAEEDSYINHYYQFTVERQGIAYIEIELPGYSENLPCTLYSESANGRMSTVVENENQRIQLPPGIYYLYIPISTYAYAADIVSDNYRCKINFAEIDASHEKESNDIWSSANELPAGTALTGNLQSEKDYDYYHVKLDKTCLFQTVLTIPRDIAEEIFFVSVHQLDSATGKLQEIDRFYSTKNPANYGKKISLPAGDYYILVKPGIDYDDDLDPHVWNNRISMIDYQISFTQPENTTTSHDSTIQNLTAVRTKKDKIKLQWKKVPNVKKYIVYRKIDDEYDQVGTSSKASFTDTIEEVGCTYYYIVRALYTSGNTTIESEDSNTASILISKRLSTPKLHLKKSGKTTRLSVNTVKFADEILIYIKYPHDRRGWMKVGALTNKDRSWKLGRTPGKKRKTYFRARAYATIGGQKVWSKYSSTKSKRI